MDCPNCSREIVQQAKFCNYCGERVAVACPSCKTLNPPDSLFCSDCGWNLAEGHAVPDETTPESSELTPPRPVGLGCPRCGAANEPGSTYCFQCGLPLDKEPQPSSGTSAVPTHAYRSPRIRAIWTSVLLVVTGIMTAIYLVMTVELLDLEQRYEAGEFLLLSQISDAEENLSDLIGFAALVGIATAIAFLFWIYRVSQNLYSLGAPGQRFSPRWAVGWWFIPIMFFFRPYQVMAEIWKGSVHRTSGAPIEHWKTESVSALVPWWWGLWIAAFVLAFFVDDGRKGIDLLWSGVEICAAVLAVVVVWRTTNHQDEKHQKMISETSW